MTLLLNAYSFSGIRINQILFLDLTTFSLSLKNEEGKEDSSSNRDSDPGGGSNTEKSSLKASDSMDSLYSLNSGQSSSSKYKTILYLLS